jgi:sugar lactone lactonase YvrE
MRRLCIALWMTLVHVLLPANDETRAALLLGQADATAGIRVGPLVYAAQLVDDDASGESSGNGDGIVNCGEATELLVDLRNLGSGPADPDIEVTPGSLAVTLSAGAVASELMTIHNTGGITLDFYISESHTTPASASTSQAGGSQSGERWPPVTRSQPTPAVALAAVGDVIHSFTVPDRPADLAWGGTSLWMVSEQSATLYKLDPFSGAVLASFPLPSHGSGEPNGWGLAWDGQYWWHGEYGPSQIIYQLDASDASAVHSFSAPSGNCMGLAWDGSHLWTTVVTIHSIHKLDPADGAVLHTIPEPAGRCLGLTWGDGTLWTADQDGAMIYEIDPADGHVLQSFASPGSHPDGLAFDGLYLWNADHSPNRIYQIDLGSDAPWLSEALTSGSVLAGHSQAITVTFDATGLSGGTYTADLLIASNDPDENPLTIPVTLSVNHAPQVGTVTPSSGSGPAGATTTFTTTWMDADGWQDLKQCYFHIGDSPAIVGNVTLMYNAVKSKLWLRSDDGSAWTGGFAPESANVLENSQAIVHCSQTTAEGSGDTLSVTWAIEFKPGYSGAKKTGLKCKDIHKARAKGKWKGTWTVE